ncbi:glycoside hydrolase family 55 protein [Bacillus tianshenii]|nr:glycoside hydrolase family 55 protein [Bacillus tianshenii]
MGRHIIIFILLIGFIMPTYIGAESASVMGNESTNSGVESLYSKYINVKDVGAKGNGEQDDTYAIVKAIEQIDSNGGGTVYFPAGTYVVNGSISVELDNDLTILSDENAVIDGENSIARTLIRLGGYRKEAAQLSKDILKGNTVIEAGLNVTEADYVLITSSDKFNLSRDYYITGELAKVSAVSGGSIQLEKPLSSSYIARSTQVVLLQMPKVIVDGLAIKRNSNDQGLVIEYAHDIELRNVNADGARERALAVNYTYGGIIERNKTTDCFYPGTGTSYGLVLASAVRDVTVQDNELVCGHHGMTLGGQEPVRDILVQNNVFDSYRGEENNYLGSFNTHSNVENITIQNNLMLAGASIGGKSLTFKGNEVHHFNRDDATLFVKLIQDMDDLVIEDNIMESEGYGIRIEGYMKDIFVKNIRIQRNEINAVQSGIWIKPRTTDDTNIHIGRLELNDNYVFAKEGIALGLRAMSNTRLGVNDIIVNGGTYHSDLEKAFYTFTDGDTNISVDGATFEIGSFNAGVQFLQGGNVNLMNANFVGLHEKGGWTNSFLNLKSLNVENSTFDKWSTISGVDIRDVGTSDVLLMKNTYANTPTRRVFAPKSVKAEKMNGVVKVNWETYVDSYKYLVKRDGKVIGKHLTERMLEDIITTDNTSTYEVYSIDPAYGVLSDPLSIQVTR